MLNKKLVVGIMIFLIFFLFSMPLMAESVERRARFKINGITGDDFIGQAGLLYPFRNTEASLWYTDLRYRLSSDDIDEWNLGLGYRYKSPLVEANLAGIYIFKDRREEYSHYWDMWTVGGEILSDQWDFRVNAYIAENDKVLAPDAVAGGTQIKEDSNSELVLVYGNEVYYKAMDGLDIEIGKRFTQTESIFKNVGVYAKFYRFFEKDTPTMLGRQLRVDKKFGELNQTNWSFGARWRDDNIRGSETEATFAVSIPFGKGVIENNEQRLSAAEVLETRMTEQPERDLDIVVGKSVSENEAAGQTVKIKNPTLAGENIKAWYVTENGSYDGKGTKADPVNIERIIDEEKGAKAGDIIVLSGRDGDILLDFEDQGDIKVARGELAAENSIYRINLKDSQQLISKRGSALIVVEGEKFEYKPDVEQATLVGAPMENGMIIPAKNNVISGLNLINKSRISATIYPFANGYLNINNNIFEFTADDIEAGYAILLFSNSSGPVKADGLEETDEGFEINILDNKFYNNSANSEESSNGLAAVIIDNYSQNDKITIKGNEIYNFRTKEADYYSAAIIITNLYTIDSSAENFVDIANNTIENSDFGVFFRNYNSENISSIELEDIREYYKNENIFKQIEPEDEVRFEFDSLER